MRPSSAHRPLALALLSAAVLTGCGGGGGDAPPTSPPPAPTVTAVAVSAFPAAFATEGDTATLTATVATSDGRPFSGAVSWASSDAAVATVANGFVTALKPGQVTITATAGSVTSAAASKAVGADTVVLLRITAPDTVFGAHPVGVGLTATNGHARPIPLPTDARLTSLAADVASAATSHDGSLVTGVSDGAATLRATATGVVTPATRSVVVVMPAVRFRVLFAGDYPAVLQRVAHRAAIRWERKFASALPTGSPITVRAGQCARTTDTTFTPGSVLEITFRVGSTPQGAVAAAGPCVLRAAPSPRFAVIGGVTLSADQVAFYTRATTDSNALLNVFTHEIGHVLGLGTLPSVPFQTGVPGDNPRFVGPTAREALASAGGRDTVGGVPYETDGQYSHWKRTSVPSEIMNPTVSGSDLVPISAISLGALRDFGYPVRMTAADPYKIP